MFRNIKIISILLVFFLNLVSVFAFNQTQAINTIIEGSSQYNMKNLLLAIYLVICFLFWWFVLTKIPEFKLTRDNLVGSLSSIVLRLVIWSWFIVLFYIAKSVIFISASSTFIQDKLYILGWLTYISIFLLSIILILNVIKYMYKVSSFEDLAKEFIFEVRNDDKK